jgi:hypothetical protein
MKHAPPKLALSLLTLMFVGAMPAAAAGSGDVLIASAADHKTLFAGDIAAGDAIGIVYQKKTLSYLRWSTDGGQTFESPLWLRNGNTSASPRLAACGSRFWTTSTWQTNLGTRFAAEYFDVGAASDRFAAGLGFRPDIACGTDAAAVTWMTQEGTGHLMVVDDTCPTTCDPAYSADLGSASSFEGELEVAEVDDGFVASWIAAGLAVQHFTVERTAGGLDVTPGPVVTLLPGKQVGSPAIAGDDARVVVAYSRRGQTHMRISENHGATFGAAIVVSNYCLNCPEGGSAPYSLDARNGRILVEVVKGGGIPTAIQSVGKLTTTGANWRTTTSGSRSQLGVLTDAIAAEVWDRHVYADPIYGDVPQEIYFHATPLN